ncbi:hypothetical protein MKP08_10195 [Erythrobacter sp. LQ02-29]|uniref:hypothetical protein n=1 Tax=Erythrobacter sp. LQ02-29 TaxID=2920384 RepID=UPI001F4DB772|nr:hypothetical protein [Erythrobacter sp. LQ02-29]
MSRRALLALALPLPLLAAGCDRARAPEPTPTPTPTVAAPRNLVAANFDPASLGAKIEGPKGPEVESEISADGKTIADVVSYVACPKDMTEACDPETAPEGTVFTYVHVVTPTQDEAAPTESATPAADTESGAQRMETAPSIFRTTRRATGFNGALGYDREQAKAALGAEDAITVTTDAGQLIWRVTKGSGWTPGMPITFFWQSTLPPKGPSSAYRLELNNRAGDATGPFPPEKAPEPKSTGTATPAG